MKGVKIFEIIIILIFTLFVLILIFQFFYKNYFRIEDKTINFYSKEDFLFRIKDIVLKCFEKYKKENKKIICHEINYFGKEEILKEEINNKIKDIKLNIVFNFVKITSNDKIFVIYSINKVELISSKDLIISD